MNFFKHIIKIDLPNIYIIQKIDNLSNSIYFIGTSTKPVYIKLMREY